MNLGVISVRYARALLKGCCDENIEDEVYCCMEALAKTYIDVPQFREVIENPMVANDKKMQLLITAVGGHPCGIVEAFFHLVLKEGRDNILQFCANSYITLYRRQKNIIRGKLTTAVAVSPETEQKLCKMVEGRTNGVVEFETEVDPDIIGGFILEYDTFRLDVSVKSKLRSIIKHLDL